MLFRSTIDCMDNKDAIMLTLDTRKVYVGYVWESPNLTEFGTILLLPAMSGYRDSNDLTVHFTTNYIKVWLDKGMGSPEDFVLVLPTSSIKSACMFDLTVDMGRFQHVSS